MNKKEVSEIKRLFHPDKNPITCLRGCYVNGEKEKISYRKEAFLSLPEEEMYKYFEILKKSMSGSLGKNLLDMEFPLTQEAEGGAQQYLMKLRESKLQDDELLDEFYDKVIENFMYPENYYIILFHGVYDIPRKASDGIEMFDASEDVYDFILCSICPVKLTKPGLSYNAQTNQIEERVRDWFVETPATAFLFPAFNDRNTDIHSILYYSKNPEELNSEFARLLLGCELPPSAGSQKATFQELVVETLQDHCTYETVKTIHEALDNLVEERKDDPNPIALDKNDVKRLLAENGAEEEVLEHFDEHFEESTGDANASIFVSNIVKRKFEIRTPNITIQVKPEAADLIETRIIDGRTCFVIPAEDGVEVNGIPVRGSVQAEDEDTLQ